MRHVSAYEFMVCIITKVSALIITYRVKEFSSPYQPFRLKSRFAQNNARKSKRCQQNRGIIIKIGNFKPFLNTDSAAFSCPKFKKIEGNKLFK